MISHFALAALLTTAGGFTMIRLGLATRILRPRTVSRRCMSCGRRIDGRTCPSCARR